MLNLCHHTQVRVLSHRLCECDAQLTGSSELEINLGFISLEMAFRSMAVETLPEGKSIRREKMRTQD